MGVSTIDGTIESIELGRKALKVRIFKRITIKLPDGTSRSLGKSLVHEDLAEHLQPGTSGRFYTFTAIDHRGVHGIRGADGLELLAFPRNNEVLMLFTIALLALWMTVAQVTSGGVPVLALILMVLSIPAYFLYRATRSEAERQFRVDAAPAPAPAAAEPAVGA